MWGRAAGGRRILSFAVLALATGATALAAATVEARAAEPAATPAPVLHGTGTAEGGLTQVRHYDTGAGSRNRVISDQNLTLRATLTFTFGVASDGTITGTGSGQYTQAAWSLQGTRGGAPFSCAPALGTSPFTVVVTGQMKGGVIAVRLTLPDAREVVPRTDCGSGFVVSAQTTGLLRSSLTNAEGRGGVVFRKAPFSQALKKDLDRSGRNYPTWTDRHEWTVNLAPPACPPSLDAKATQSYGAGMTSLREASRQVTRAEKAYFKFRGQEGANYRQLNILAFQARKAGSGQIANFWSIPELTTPWITRDVLPAIRQYNGAIGAARKAWRAAEVQFKRSITEAKDAKPVRIPCESDYRQIGYAAGQRISLAEDKLKRIAKWNRSGQLSMSPSVGPLVRESRLLAGARRLLPAGPRGSTVSVTAGQLLAASSRITAGLALQKQAMKLQDRSLGAAETIRRGLLRALRR